MGDGDGTDLQDQRADGGDRFAGDPAFAVHEGGKLVVRATRPITSTADLALTYTPGVARVSSAIAAEPGLARRFTWAPRTVASGRSPRRPAFRRSAAGG